MITPARTAVVLLAAGRSRRFGDVDKLTQTYLGRPLALHIVATLADLPFPARIAITSGTDLDFAAQGYTVVRNHRPDAGISGSIRLGVQAAQRANADAVLIALADMPLVSTGHILRLFDAADGAGTVVASSDGTRPSPPALFSGDHFAMLLGLTGDEGARRLIATARHIIAPARELMDVDRPEDLQRLHAPC